MISLQYEMERLSEFVVDKKGIEPSQNPSE